MLTASVNFPGEIWCLLWFAKTRNSKWIIIKRICTGSDNQRVEPSWKLQSSGEDFLSRNSALLLICRYGVSLDRIVGSCWVKGMKALPAIPARWRASCSLPVIPVLMIMISGNGETADYLSLLIFPGYCLSENIVKTTIFVLHVNELQVHQVFIPIVYFPTVLKGTKSKSRMFMFLLFSGRASGLWWSSSHGNPCIPVPTEDTPLNSLQGSYFCFLKSSSSYSRCGSYIIDFIFLLF